MVSKATNKLILITGLILIALLASCQSKSIYRYMWAEPEGSGTFPAVAHWTVEVNSRGWIWIRLTANGSNWTDLTMDTSYQIDSEKATALIGFCEKENRRIASLPTRGSDLVLWARYLFSRDTIPFNDRSNWTMRGIDSTTTIGFGYPSFPDQQYALIERIDKDIGVDTILEAWLKRIHYNER